MFTGRHWPTHGFQATKPATRTSTEQCPSNSRKISRSLAGNRRTTPPLSSGKCRKWLSTAAVPAATSINPSNSLLPFNWNHRCLNEVLNILTQSCSYLIGGPHLGKNINNKKYVFETEIWSIPACNKKLFQFSHKAWCGRQPGFRIRQFRLVGGQNELAPIILSALVCKTLGKLVDVKH